MRQKVRSLNTHQRQLTVAAWLSGLQAQPEPVIALYLSKMQRRCTFSGLIQLA